MAKTGMEIVMSEDLKQRLQVNAIKLHKTVQELAQEALYTYVEDRRRCTVRRCANGRRFAVLPPGK